MTLFSIAVYDASGAILIPGSLTVTPVTWSAIARGGMDSAEVQVTGGIEQLAGLTAWLGYRLEIVNRNGAPVWWGDIDTVEVVATGVRRGISLDRLANRVMVRYAQAQPGGTAIAADTAWGEDAASQAKYGVRERRVSPVREMSAAEALNYRDTALATLAQPHYTLMPDSGEPMAIVRCTGYWRRLGRTYYAQAAGLEECNVTGSGVPMGQGFTSSYVAFTTNTDVVHAVQGEFANFMSGSTVAITGAAHAGNNASFEILRADARPAMGRTATSVSFAAANDINDTGGLLGFLEPDDALVVTGSTANSGTHQLKTAGSQHVEISAGFFGGTITAEAAGPSITIARGNSIAISGNLVNEAAGNSVTVTTWGKKVYSSFQFAAALTWYGAAIEIRIRKVGTPTDNVTVQLVTDSSGVPGTVHETSSIAAANIPVDMGWVSFPLAGTTSLDSATVYGITIARSGANSEVNFYEVDTDDALGYARGAVKVYDGAAWHTPSPDADLAFRVLGAVDTGAQATMIMQAAAWALWISVETSGVKSWQWRAGELTCLDELNSLLDMGTSAAKRMIAHTTRDLAAVVYAKPDRIVDSVRWVWNGAGRLTDTYGIDAEPGLLPVGEWVRLGDTSDLGPWAALSPVFVERAEYSTGGLSIEPEGQEDAYDVGVQQG